MKLFAKTALLIGGIFLVFALAFITLLYFSESRHIETPHAHTPYLPAVFPPKTGEPRLFNTKREKLGLKATIPTSFSGARQFFYFASLIEAQHF